MIPDDVTDLVTPVFSHRLSFAHAVSDALEERRAVAAVLKRIVEALPAPQ